MGLSHATPFKPVQLLSVQQKYPSPTQPALFPLVFCKLCPGWGLPHVRCSLSPSLHCLWDIPTTSPCPAAPGAATTTRSPTQTQRGTTQPRARLLLLGDVQWLPLHFPFVFVISSFFFSYLPTPQTTVFFLCSFSQWSLNRESKALTTAKARRTRGI